MSGTSGKSAVAGFSLVETMLAIAVAGLLLTIAVPGVTAYRERRSFVETQAIVAEGISRARAAAITTGVPHTVLFGRGRISIVGGSAVWEKEIPKDTALSILSARELQIDGHPALAFFGDGTSSGASIELRVGRYEASRSISWIDGGRPV